MQSDLPVGTRVRNIRTNELGTIAERDRCSPERATVRYDFNDSVWNTLIRELVEVEREQS